ncbi:MAG: hypothetical protein V4481_00340 [Patescibacteria group bacterium]
MSKPWLIALRVVSIVLFIVAVFAASYGKPFVALELHLVAGVIAVAILASVVSYSKSRKIRHKWLLWPLIFVFGCIVLLALGFMSLAMYAAQKPKKPAITA